MIKYPKTDMGVYNELMRSTDDLYERKRRGKTLIWSDNFLQKVSMSNMKKTSTMVPLAKRIPLIS